MIWNTWKFKICFQKSFPEKNNIIHPFPVLWYSSSAQQRGIFKIWIIVFIMIFARIFYKPNFIHIFFSHSVVITYKFFQFYLQVIRCSSHFKCFKLSLEFRTDLEYFKAWCLSWNPIKDLMISSSKIILLSLMFLILSMAIDYVNSFFVFVQMS